MKCKSTYKDLIFYIDGELSSQRRKEISRHLESCPECMKLYNELKATLGIVELEKNVEPNPFLATRIKENISKSRNKKSLFAPSFQKIFQPALFSFLMVVGIFAGVMLGNSFTPTNTGKLSELEIEQSYLNDLQQEQIELVLLND